MVLDDTLKNYFSSAAGASADHTTALRAPPQRGATMNTQRSLRAWPPAKRAGPMERAGFTDVPVSLMHTRWMRMRDRPIARPAKLPAPTLLSVVPRTTNTKRNVAMNSTRNAPPAPPALATALVPRPPVRSGAATTFVRMRRIAPAMTAPMT